MVAKVSSELKSFSKLKIFRETIHWGVIIVCGVVSTWYYIRVGLTVHAVSFNYTFQNLRDLVSVSATHEPDVISSHILQSAFLAEERVHPKKDDWERSNISTRAKNVLRRLQEKNVPHAILKDHKAYSNPRQDVRISFETRRLIRRTNIVREEESSVIAMLAFLAASILTLAVSINKILTAHRDTFLYCYGQILRFFSNNDILASVIYVSYGVIPVLCLGSLFVFVVTKATSRWYLLSPLKPICEGITVCFVFCTWPLFWSITICTVSEIVNEHKCVTFDVGNCTIEMTDKLEH